MSNCSCNFNRPQNSALEEEKKVYNVSLFDADTMYCHHLNSEGKHCVLNNIDSSNANKCNGIMYVSYSLQGKHLICGNPRGFPYINYKHNPCNENNCPFIKKSGKCPYMNLKK